MVSSTVNVRLCWGRYAVIFRRLKQLRALCPLLEQIWIWIFCSHFRLDIPSGFSPDFHHTCTSVNNPFSILYVTVFGLEVTFWTSIFYFLILPELKLPDLYLQSFLLQSIDSASTILFTLERYWVTDISPFFKNCNCCRKLSICDLELEANSSLKTSHASYAVLHPESRRNTWVSYDPASSCPDRWDQHLRRSIPSDRVHLWFLRTAFSMKINFRDRVWFRCFTTISLLHFPESSNLWPKSIFSDGVYISAFFRWSPSSMIQRKHRFYRTLNLIPY